MEGVNERQLALDWDACGWCDLWHAHDLALDPAAPDGLQRHVAELEQLLERVLAFARRRRGPWQVWLSLDPDDPEQDAVYLHTPNPQSDFPARFDRVEAPVAPPRGYERLAEGREVGRFVRDGGVPGTYVVRAAAWSRVDGADAPPG